MNPRKNETLRCRAAFNTEHVYHSGACVYAGFDVSCFRCSTRLKTEKVIMKSQDFRRQRVIGQVDEAREPLMWLSSAGHTAALDGDHKALMPLSRYKRTNHYNRSFSGVMTTFDQRDETLAQIQYRCVYHKCVSINGAFDIYFLNERKLWKCIIRSSKDNWMTNKGKYFTCCYSSLQEDSSGQTEMCRGGESLSQNCGVDNLLARVLPHTKV
ncbi:hypothetical protein F2P81_022330 [Scophthalmus maximus]|uniref:Uncharacterized protein n=1 Tax=Scophthalmus maximus TaxID=52904 RepID=A0A6A4RYS4_SCOMX|nr:hypothetical protein F2P81_022330 [Scophthalmus maximus]